MVQLALVNIRLSTVVNTIVLVNQFVPVLQGYVFLERPKGGYSGVSLRSGGTVDILAEQAAGEVLLRVTDTGEGISQEDLDKVFDPFFTRAPLGKGTGLGLSICHSIVDQHGGSIGVESQSGKGSTFTVKLPRSR